VGGFTATITGSGFSTVSFTSILFGGAAATNINVINDTTLTLTYPANPPGWVSVIFYYDDAVYGFTGYDPIIKTNFFYYEPTYLNLGLSSANINFMPTITDLATANLLTGSTIYTVSTNYPDGYLLDMSMADTTLRCINNGAGSPNPSATIPTGVTSGAINSGSYGWAVQNNQPSGNTGWSAVPSSYNLKTTTSAKPSPAGEQTTAWFGVRADINTIPCVYSGTILITAVLR
jgi:hypothetical protein